MNKYTTTTTRTSSSCQQNVFSSGTLKFMKTMRLSLFFKLLLEHLLEFALNMHIIKHITQFQYAHYQT